MVQKVLLLYLFFLHSDLDGLQRGAGSNPTTFHFVYVFLICMLLLLINISNNIFNLQHYLTMIGAIVAIPFILCPALCMEETDPDRSNIISTMIFVTGKINLKRLNY